MRKRLISTILTLIMILSFADFSVDAEEDYGKNTELCIGLGFVKDYKPEQIVTRGYFASILADMLRIDTDSGDRIWTGAVYGDKNDSQTADLNDSASMFDDVDESYPYYNAIMAICSKGYMRGTGARRFAPEYDISILEVVKVLCDMAGYARMCEINGGYPTGYETVAQELGILSRVNKNFREPANEEDVLNIIYNMLNVEMMEFNGFNSNDIKYEKSEKTFMQEVLKTYLVKATLSDNGITALSSPSAIGKEEIKVGGVVAVLPEELSEYRKLIGRRVELYYTYENDEYTVRYVRVSDTDKSYTFSVRDLVKVEKEKITFEQGNRTITKSIKSTANLIYNNKCRSFYNDDVFSFETGDITLCDAGTGEYSTIIINDYKTAYVANVNTNDSLIYNGIKSSGTGTNIIDLSPDKYPDFFSITDGKGKKYSVDEIPVGSVLSILEASDGIEVIVTENKVSDFSVKTLGTETLNNIERTVLSDGETEYFVLKSYSESANAEDFRVGNKYTLYLNDRAEVAYAEKNENNEGVFCGILIKVFYDEDTSETPERILTIFTEDGERKKIFADEKIKLNDVKYKYKDIINDLNKELGNPILYTTDKQGVILSVTTACAYGDNEAEKRGWCRISPEGNTYRFGTNGKDFDRFFYYVAGKTTIFQTPTEYSEDAYADETKFQLSTGGFSDNDELYVEGFAKSPDAAEADVIVWRKFKNDAASKEGSVNARNAFLIEKISYGITNEDETVLQIKGYQMNVNNSNAEYKELTIDPEAIMITSGDVGIEIDKNADPKTVGPRTPDELEAGDVIRFETNSKGYVNYIRIAYDMSTNKAFFAGTGTNFAPGSSYAGYAVSTFNDSIRIATSVLPESINYKDYTAVRNSLKSFRISNSPIFMVEKMKNKVKVSKATLNDVLSYNVSGSEYNKIAIFTYYSSLVYGMVIYK